MKMNSIFKPRDYSPPSYRLMFYTFMAYLLFYGYFVQILHINPIIHGLIVLVVLAFIHIRVKQIEKSNTYLMASPWFYILAFVCSLAMILYIYTH